MAGQGRDGTAEHGDAEALRGNAGEAARDHRIARPDEGAQRRQHMAELDTATAGAEAARDQHRRRRKADQGAGEMAQLQPAARQKRREQHDQQRPEIMDQIGLGRRRRLDRGIVERAVAEGTVEPKEEGGRRRPRQMQPASRRRDREDEQAADHEGHGDELERRNPAAHRCE